MSDMKFIGWMYDIAREQAPSAELLGRLVERSQAAGYNALGLYVEHRFAYASAPWARGPGAVTPEVVRSLAQVGRARGVRIIPFLNTLGHMEGFLRSEGGQGLAESLDRNYSLQICPSRPAAVAFVHGLIDDALAAFDDEWVHLGGDEAWQLGECPQCAARVAAGSKGRLYAEHYGPLCRRVLEHGRRPCLWGDMLLHHPDAVADIPRETVIFDWHYDSAPGESTRLFRQHGFDVVCCPAVRSYDSGWCHLGETQRMVDAHAADARTAGALGVLVTTWECAYASTYGSLWPVIMAAGRRLARGTDWHAALVEESHAGYAQAVELLGNRVSVAARLLAPGGWRQLREFLIIRQNPFLLWRRWREEATGPAGDEVLRLCARAAELVPEDEPLHAAVELHRVAVEWVRLVEAAYREYADGAPGRCVERLGAGRALLERLRPGLVRAAGEGGSTADVARLEVLLTRVAEVMARVAAVPADAAQRPAFEVLTHAGYVAGDQTAWMTGAY